MVLVAWYTCPRRDTTYYDKHEDGSWWIHYRDDDGTAPPIPMVEANPNHWHLYTPNMAYYVNDEPSLTPPRRRKQRKARPATEV